MVYLDVKEMFKDAKNIAEGANDLQLKNHLLEIQSEVYDLLDENRDLRLKLEELNKQKTLGMKLLIGKSGYYLEEDGPFCTRCWDVDKHTVRLTKNVGARELRFGDFQCPNCDKFF